MSFADCGVPRFLEEAGLWQLVEFDAEESQIGVAGPLAEGRSFDFAFVDGNHRFDRVFLYVNDLWPARAPRKGSSSSTTISCPPSRAQ